MASKLGEAVQKTGIVARHLFEHPNLVRKMLSHLYKGFLFESGWLKAFIEKRPVDARGNPLPWFTYPIIAFLDERLTDDLSVFEYGGGNSTLYLSTRVKRVVTLEHNAKWFELLKRQAPANARIIHSEVNYGGSYAQAVAETGEKFDVIVIDGRDRVNCAKTAADAVSDRGVIIIDDLEREHYQPAVAYLAGRGFRQLSFWGFKPGFFDPSNTAIFYRDGNVLGI